MTHVLKTTAASEASKKLYLNENFADVFFVFGVDDEIEKVPANKANLAVLSPVFEAMFYGSLTEKGDVKIADADIDGFKEFLQFFYLNEATITMKNIETVVRLADKYDILQYVNACAETLKSQLRIDKMCWVYQLAINLKNEELIKFCENKIIEWAEEVLKTDAFRRCDKNTLKCILKLDLNCKATDIFDASLVWAKYACKQNGLDETQAINLKTQLGHCWKLIRSDSMTTDEFRKRYVSQKELFTAEEVENIMLSLKAKHNETIDRNHSTYRWDSANILQCKLKTDNPYPKKFITGPEVISFSSNSYVLLGEFNTASSFGIVGTEVEVTITESEDLTFQSNTLPQTLHRATSKKWCNNQLKVILLQPILIKPDKMYEIRLCARSPNGYYFFSKCKPIIEMEDEIKIQFHRNPTLNYDNLSFGWISDLFFNKI